MSSLKAGRVNKNMDHFNYRKYIGKDFQNEIMFNQAVLIHDL